MIEVVIHAMRRRKELKVPERWEELTPAQYLAVCDILYNNAPNPRALKVRLLMAITGMKRWYLLFLGEENVARLLVLTDFLLKAPKVQEQLMPEIKVDGRTYHGPKAHLRNLKAGEFHACEKILARWHRKYTDLKEDIWKDEEALECLYEFVATIYRPGKRGYLSSPKKTGHPRLFGGYGKTMVIDPDGDIREAYNQNATAHYAALFRKKLKLSYARSILLWYLTCKEWMHEQYAYIFSGGDGEQDKGAVSDNAYFELMRAVANAGTYGDMDKVEQMYIYTLLEELICSKRDAERLERDNHKRYAIPDEQL